MKCFACGKRWNLGGPPPKIHEDAEDSVDITIADSSIPRKRTGDDIVKLVMDLSRKQPAKQEEETPMGWSEEAREQHKKKMKDIWAKKRAGGGTAAPTPTGSTKPKRKYTFVNRQPAGEPSAPVPQLPAKRPHAPITLAEPTLLDAPPARRMDLDGNVLTVLDGLIAQRESELVMLRGTKEILERHG